MASKEALLRKLTARPIPRNFTMRELDQLMRKCGCIRLDGGRGSGILYAHPTTKRKLTFDQPHPGNELYLYQLKKVIDFLIAIGEWKGESQ